MTVALTDQPGPRTQDLRTVVVDGVRNTVVLLYERHSQEAGDW